MLVLDQRDLVGGLIMLMNSSRTEQLVSNAIAMGVSHITIHGRTRFQASTEPVDLPGLAFAVDVIGGRVPTVANGDLWTLDDAEKMRGTGVDGVMGARGLLAKYVPSDFTEM